MPSDDDVVQYYIMLCAACGLASTQRGAAEREELLESRSSPLPGRPLPPNMLRDCVPVLVLMAVVRAGTAVVVRAGPGRAVVVRVGML